MSICEFMWEVVRAFWWIWILAFIAPFVAYRITGRF